MPTLLKDGLITVFTFFVFTTLYLILNNLGYLSILTWIFLLFNMLFMAISLFLVLQANEKAVKETGHEARVFWIIALGMFNLVGILLQFVFLYETKTPTPATVGLAATLTTITVIYFLMAKEMYETRV